MGVQRLERATIQRDCALSNVAASTAKLSKRKWHLVFIASAVLLGAWSGLRYHAANGAQSPSHSAAGLANPVPSGSSARAIEPLALASSAKDQGAKNLQAPPADVSVAPPQAAMTPSGVAYRVLKPGEGGATPLLDDRVSVHYTTWKRNGALVDSSRARGEPFIQTLRYVMPGLSEVLAGMSAGELRRAWIPARLTFAPNEEKPHVPEDLTIEVELLQIRRAPVLPPSARRVPSHAKRTASGLAYEFIKPRPSEARPILPNTRVTYLHTVWRDDGTLFESSEMSEQPVMSVVGTLIPGLREGLPLLRQGDRVRFWIPAALAYGTQPRRHQPAGALICELELLKVE